MPFDIAQELSDARSRLVSDVDRDIWDRTLENAQSEPPALRAMLECALSMCGLEQSDLAYQQHLYPFDTPSQALAMAKSQSGCGLTTEEIWRAGGASNPALTLSYAWRVARGGVLYAVALEKEIALEAKAWQDTRNVSAALERCDALIIGCKGCPGPWAKNTFTDEHEFTIVLMETLADGTILVHSVDGGQPGIALRTRKLVLTDSGETWLASLDAVIEADGRPSKGRRLQGYSRASQIPGIAA